MFLICRVDAVRWWVSPASAGGISVSLVSTPALELAAPRTAVIHRSEQGTGAIAAIVVVVLKHPPSPATLPVHRAGEKPHTERFRNSTEQGSRGVKITGGNTDFTFPLSVGASRVSQHGNDLDTDRPFILPWCCLCHLNGRTHLVDLKSRRWCV